MQNIDPTLREDCEHLLEVLSGFGAYRFGADVAERMTALGLSSVALGRRCLVSHTIVDRWKAGSARPNSRERLKELGMALAMDEGALNRFLLCNGYPALYVKNPLDAAARLLLARSAGEEDLVPLYRQLIARLGLDRCPPRQGWADSRMMSRQFRQAVAAGEASRWFHRFRSQFAEDEKQLSPRPELARLLVLYLGDESIAALSAAQMPKALTQLLYPLRSGRAVTVRTLREKLIAFGLFADLTEEALDELLTAARLRPLSQPVTATDAALLTALRCAHERWPYYELEVLHRLLSRLEAPRDDFESRLLERCRERLGPVTGLCDYYDRHRGTERAFEERYTSYNDRGVMDYVHDLLQLLTDRQALPVQETRSLLRLTERKETGESLWN